MTWRRLLLESVLPPVALLVLVIAGWELLVWGWGIEAYILPAPRQIAAAAAEEPGKLLSAMGYTLMAAALGFGISLVLGTFIGSVFAQSPVIRRAGYPYAIFLQTVPIIAIGPLVIALSGQNFRSVVLIAAVISLFPMITNVTTGLLAVDPKLVELFAVLRASRWQQLWKLQIPTAVPYALIGAKTSSGLAMVGAIVGELFAGYGSDKPGLGYLLSASNDNLRTDRMFAAVLAAALLGISIFALVNLVAAVLLRRWTEA